MIRSLKYYSSPWIVPVLNYDWIVPVLDYDWLSRVWSRCKLLQKHTCDRIAPIRVVPDNGPEFSASLLQSSMSHDLSEII